MLEKLIEHSAAILNSDFMSIVIIEDGLIVWANAAMHRLFGYQPGELIGQPTRNLFLNQEDYEEFGRDAYSVIQNGGTYAKTIPQKRKDGTSSRNEINISSLAGYPNIAVGAIIDRSGSNQSIDPKSLYQSVLESQTEVISRFLPDGTFVFVNDVFCRVFGKSATELIGHSWHPVAHPDDLSIIDASLRKMSPLQPVVTIENRVFVAGGELRWMQFVNCGVYDSSRTLMEIQAVGRDITYLKQIESNLRESEVTLQRAQSVARIGSFTMNEETETFKITQETTRLFDLNDNGVTTFAEWFSRVHPDDQAKVETAWRAALQGAPYDMTYRIMVRGQIRWIRAIAELQFDGQGQLAKAVGTVQDISDFKQIESNLRESDERLELALEGTGLVLWDWNIPERKVTAGNRWFELLGYKYEELGNDEDKWLDLINPKDLKHFKQKISSHLQDETAIFESEHQLRHKQGHLISVEAKGKVTRRDKDYCNGQLKPDTFLSSVFKKIPLKLQRRFVA